MAIGCISLPVVVIGPADLATTAIVTALRSYGIDVERSVEPANFDTAENPGVAVIDAAAPEDAVRRVADVLGAGWTLLVLGDDGRSPRVAAAVAAGAAGWLSTQVPIKKLACVVRDLQVGRPIISDDERICWVALHTQYEAEAERRKFLLDRLTDREFAVLRALERGQKAAEIATANVVALTTVRTQIRSILQKLEVSSQGAAKALYQDALRAKNDRW